MQLDGRAPSFQEEDLPRLSQDTNTIQLAIAGAGPAGLAVADRVSQSGETQLARGKLSCKVCLI